MDYVVRPLPGVTRPLASADRAVQDQFQHILGVIALAPSPNPQFPLVTEDWTAEGSRIFSYSDDQFPYVIQYVTFEPDEANFGLIVVIDLKLARGRRTDA